MNNLIFYNLERGKTIEIYIDNSSRPFCRELLINRSLLRNHLLDSYNVYHMFRY